MASVERSPQETFSQLLTVGSTVLGQALTLLAGTVLTEEQLTYTSKHIPGSTIGKVHRFHVSFTVNRVLNIHLSTTAASAPCSGSLPAAARCAGDVSSRR